MKRALAGAAAFVLLMSSQALAGAPSDTIKGHVADQAGKAVAGAEVVVSDVDRVAVTNANGDFTLVAPLSSMLLVRRAGYATVTLNAQRLMHIELAASAFALEPINVTATRQALTSAASLATAGLSREQLQREAGVSLAHELDHLPGVHTLSTGEQVGKPVIRGLYGSRVLVLEDAMRLEDYSWSDEDAPSVDARFADRVEVVRGPVSILYGSDAVGGVVNVVPAPVPQPGSQVRRSSIDLSASSNRREAGIAGRTEGASSNLGWRALVIGHFAEDFRTPRGPVGNTGYGALNGEFAVGTQKEWGALTLRYARYAGEFKLLESGGPDQPAGGKDEGPERKLADDRIQLVGAFPVGAVRLEARLQYQRHWLQEVADELTPAGQPKVEAPVFELLLNTFTSDLVAQHSLRRNMNGSLGVTLTAQKNDSRGVLPVVPDATMQNAGIFALERWTTGPIDWIAGARLDSHNIDPAATKGLAVGARNSSSESATYNAGTVVRLTQRLSLRGNVGRSWRAPNLFELYANGPRIGESRFEIGDPALIPEHGTEIDAGADLSTQLLKVRLSLYDNRVDNFIVLQPTSATQDGLRVYKHQQTDALLRGAEAYAEVTPGKHLSITAEYDAVRGSDRVTDTPLPWMPAPRMQSHVEVAGPKGGFRHAYALFGLEHVWPKTRIAANEPRLDAYTLFDFGAGGERLWNGHNIRIDASVKNAFNASYTDFLNRYRDFALNPGRDFTLRLSYQM